MSKELKDYEDGTLLGEYVEIIESLENNKFDFIQALGYIEGIIHKYKFKLIDQLEGNEHAQNKVKEVFGGENEEEENGR